MNTSETSAQQAKAHAEAIAAAGGIEAAIEAGTLSQFVDVTVSEGIILGLLRQGVRKYLAIFGHGSTSIGDMLRIYEAAGLVRTFAFHNEVSMAHAATTLRWLYDEPVALVASIGPGPLQAMAGALTSITNGVGLYHIYGDETTHGEGQNFQGIPKPTEQHLFSRMTALASESYLLHTPQALRDMMRRGSARVFHPFQAGPFFIHVPMNIQPRTIEGLNLLSLPQRMAARLGAASEPDLDAAAELIARHKRIVIKAGGGSRRHGEAIRRLAERIGAAVITSPVSAGVLPDAHPNNLHVGGTKGSLSGNFAMSQADLVIVAGSRSVCQADCSGLGYKNAEAVININADWSDANHYNKTVALIGDLAASIDALLKRLERTDIGNRDAWRKACGDKKREWRALREERYAVDPQHDPVWKKPVLTQPVVIKEIVDFAKSVDAVKFFDSGDVQCNALQICEDDGPFDTMSEGGASYMGFAVSSLVASAIADRPRYSIAVSGDGAFWMNPQVLTDGIEHRVRGMIVLLDNRRMGAISGLQAAQFGEIFATNDAVAVDYVALSKVIPGLFTVSGGHSRKELQAALKSAHDYDGLSLVHVPVHWSTDETIGNLGSYGSWNVGNWCEESEREYARTTI
jgi:3D-(3,5/4)-trihydroxycyclohexane-1,2-dione acylhydrolase (decyclizing)